MRGIIHPWKQIVYCEFVKNMDMELLRSLIVQCENANVKIRAIVCDMGNVQLLSHLKVYKTYNHFFTNPFDKIEKNTLFVTPHIALRTCAITPWIME